MVNMQATFVIVLSFQAICTGFDFTFQPKPPTGVANQFPGDVCGVLYCEEKLGNNFTDTRNLSGLTLYGQASAVGPDGGQWKQLASITPQTAGHLVGDAHQSGRLSATRGHLRLQLVKLEDCMSTQFSCSAILIDTDGKTTFKKSVIGGKIGSYFGPGPEVTGHDHVSGAPARLGGQTDQLSVILEKLRCIETRLLESAREDDKLKDKLESLKDSMTDKVNSVENSVVGIIHSSEMRIQSSITNVKDKLDDKLSEIKVSAPSGGVSHDMCSNSGAVEDTMQSIAANISSLGSQINTIENAVTKSEAVTTSMDGKLEDVISKMSHVSTHTSALTDSVAALSDSCVPDKQEPVQEFWDPLGTGDNDWRLAFRGTAHSGVQVYPAYLYGTGIPAEVEIGCKQFNQSMPCTNHYRNWDALENWVNVDEVLFAIYVKDRVVKHIIFNGRGSTFTNWFEVNRVILSTWNDLKSLPHNFFSIEGDSRSALIRRFFMNNYYKTCSTDKGWFFAGDIAPGHCNWEQKLAVPAFLYATGHTVAVWTSSDVARADAIGVFLKYK